MIVFFQERILCDVKGFQGTVSRWVATLPSWGESKRNVSPVVIAPPGKPEAPFLPLQLQDATSRYKDYYDNDT